MGPGPAAAAEAVPEPPLRAAPPADLGVFTPDTTAAERLRGREIWLSAPWALRAPPPDLPEGALCIGEYLREHHAAWPLARSALALGGCGDGRGGRRALARRRRRPGRGAGRRARGCAPSTTRTSRAGSIAWRGWTRRRRCFRPWRGAAPASRSGGRASRAGCTAPENCCEHSRAGRHAHRAARRQLPALSSRDRPRAGAGAAAGRRGAVLR
ncbi:MAG: hypothetical protein MZW92_36980 [Comamonadaceae bacterium]|nr:hypothetical protein [Comamonadaceae bacterium]